MTVTGRRPSDLMREHGLPGRASVDPDVEPVGRPRIDWRPDADYMRGKGGWEEALEYGSWREFAGAWLGGDRSLNLVADFYFEAAAERAGCGACGGSGRNEATRRVAADVRAMLAGRATGDAISPEEALELHRRGRTRGPGLVPPRAALEAAELGDGEPLARALNAAIREAGPARFFFADSVTRGILVETRAGRLGVLGACHACDGDGSVPAEPERLQLLLWILHPRVGGSRGVAVRSVREEELAEVREWLKGSLTEHEARFGWVRSGERR